MHDLNTNTTAAQNRRLATLETVLGYLAMALIGLPIGFLFVPL